MAINLTTSVTQNKGPVALEASGRSAVQAEQNRPVIAESRQAPAAQAEPAASDVRQAVSQINDYLQNINRELHFRVDDALPLGRTVVSIIDSETQETIREFPSKEALALARRLQEQQLDAASLGFEGMILSDQA